MPDLRFIISTDSAGAVTGVMRYRQAVSSLGPATSTASQQTTTAFNRIEATLNKAKSAMVGFVAAVALAKVVQGFNQMVQAGIDFESSFAGIRKTVSAAEAEFEKLSGQIRQMAKDIPIGVTELNKIGEIAGQLGIPADKIANFTALVAKMGLTTNLSVEDAANGFARFANIMDVSIDTMQTFGSVIVRLGNEFPATEQEILAFSLNLASAGKLVNLTTSQVAALATALASSGLHAEKAGSAMSRIMIEMQKAVEKGGEELAKFAEIAGAPSIQKFVETFRTDASTALLQFLGGLDKLAESGKGAIGALEALHLSEIRVRDVALRSAAAVDVYSKAMSTAADESTKAGAALETEFAKRMQTARAELDKAWARINDVAISIADQLVPALTVSAKGLASLAEAAAGASRTFPGLITYVGLLAAALLSLKLGTLVIGMSAVQTAVAGLGLAFGTAGGAAYVFQLALAAIGGPLTIAIAAIVSLGGLLIGLTNAWEREAEAQMDAEKAQNTYQLTLNKSIERLKALGIVVTQNNLAGIQQAEEALAFKQWFDQQEEMLHRKSLARIDEEAEAREAEKKAYKAQIESMVKSLNKEKNETQALVEVLRIAGTMHVSMEAIISRFGKEIQEAVKHTKSLKEEDAALIKAYNEHVEAAAKVIREQEVIDDNLRHVNQTFLAQQVALLALNRDWARYQDWLKSNSASLDAATVRLREFNAEMAKQARFMELNNILPSVPHLPISVPPIISPSDIPIPAGSPHTAEEIEKEGKAVIERLTGDIARMFKNAVGHGKSFWEAFKTMGMGAIASVATTLFDKILHGFLDPLTDKFGKWMLDFETWVDGTLVPKVKEILKSFGSMRGLALAGVGAGIGAAVSGGSKTGTAAGALGGAAVNQALSGNWVAAAVTGIAAVGTAFLGMIGSLRKEANKFVQGIQNPFTQAVDDIFKGLTEAKDMGSLTVKQVSDAKKQFESMWTSFQEEAAKTGIVGEQAMRTMTPFVASWREWLGSLENAANHMERLAKVKDITDKVLNAAEGWDILEIAIQDMMDRGVDWAVIIKFLGTDIKDMADKMTALGIAIPPAIKSIVDAMDAMEAMEKAARRQAEVETELAQTRDALINAYIAKLDFLDAEIQKGTDAIDKYRDRIADINTEIGEQTAKLNDLEFWHKRYNDLIKDETDALKEATDARKSAQERILDLERSVTKDRLEMQLLAAQKSKKQSRIDAAEAAIDAFELQLKKKDMASRAAELAQLKRDLPTLISLEKQAQAALVSASIAATEQLNIEKQQIMERILNLQGEREQLQKNITTTEIWIQTLEKDKATTERMLESIGGKRRSEWEKINDTISSLTERGLKLEEERDALSKLTGIAKESVDAFHNLARAIQEAAQVQVTPAQQSPAQVALGPAPTPLFPESSTNPGGIPTVPNGYVNTDGLDIFGIMRQGGFPSFKEGTSDTGPKPLLAMLHPHEAVVPREQNMGGGVTYSPSVTVNIRTTGGIDKRVVRDTIVPEILSALETNSSQIVQKFHRKIVPSSQKLINK